MTLEEFKNELKEKGECHFELVEKGRLVLALAGKEQKLFAVMEVCDYGSVKDKASLATAMLSSNFMWQGGPFTMAIDADSGKVIMEERLSLSDFSRDEDVDAYVARAEDEWLAALNMVKSCDVEPIYVEKGE